MYGDLALIFFDDASPSCAQNPFCLRAYLRARLLHRLFRFPVADGHALTGLPVPHERHADEALLLLDEGQDLLSPLLDRLVPSWRDRPGVESLDCTIRHLRVMDTILPGQPGRSIHTPFGKGHAAESSSAVAISAYNPGVVTFDDFRQWALDESRRSAGSSR